MSPIDSSPHRSNSSEKRVTDESSNESSNESEKNEESYRSNSSESSEESYGESPVAPLMRLSDEEQSIEAPLELSPVDSSPHRSNSSEKCVTDESANEGSNESENNEESYRSKSSESSESSGESPVAPLMRLSDEEQSVEAPLELSPVDSSPHRSNSSKKCVTDESANEGSNESEKNEESYRSKSSESSEESSGESPVAPLMRLSDEDQSIEAPLELSPVDSSPHRSNFSQKSVTDESSNESSNESEKNEQSYRSNSSESSEESYGESSVAPLMRLSVEDRRVEDSPELSPGERSPSPGMQNKDSSAGKRLDTLAVGLDGNVLFEEDARNAEIGIELSNVWNAVTNAQSVITNAESKWYATNSALREEKRTLENLLDKEKNRLDCTLKALQETTSKVLAVEGSRDAALVAVQEEKKSMQSLTKDVEDEKKKRCREHEGVVTVILVQQQKLYAERDELKQETDVQLLARTVENRRMRGELNSVLNEKTKLSGELNTALNEKTKLDGMLDTALATLSSVEGERDGLKYEFDATKLALAEQKAHVVKERDDNLKLQTKISAILCKKRKFKRDIFLLREEMTDQKSNLETEMADQKSNLEKEMTDQKSSLEAETADQKRTLEQAHELKLGWERKNFLELKSQLLVARREKKECLSQVASMAKEVIRLETSLGITLGKLEEETEKKLCGICMESPQDAMLLPCLHYQFCFACLEKHRAVNNTCPACRASINGVLRSDIGK